MVYSNVTLASKSAESGPALPLSMRASMYAKECTYPVSTVKPCSLSAINAVRSRKSWQCSHLDSVTMDFVGALDSLKVSLISSE
jgi:hypothetical protein